MDLFQSISLFSDSMVEFPRECVKKLIAMIKEGGLPALKENKLDAVMCLCMVIAWALGRLNHEDRDTPFGDSSEGESDMDQAITLTDVMRESGDLPPQPASGFLQGIIARQLLSVAVSYLISILSDIDKIEDLAVKVMDWLADQRSKPLIGE